MSRIGNAPIPVPSGVDVSVDGSDVTCKGPKGELSYTLPEGITARVDGEELVVERPDDERDSKALHGLARSLVNNMVVGVNDGFRKDLEIIGVGYRAAAKGKSGLDLQLGYSHPISYDAPEGIEFEVPDQQKISVIGIDKQALNFAAQFFDI